MRLFCLPLSLLALGGLALVWLLLEYWGIDSEYSDRFLVLLACLGLIYRLLPIWKQTPIRPTWSGLIVLFVGLIGFVPVWNLVAQVGARNILLWWLTLSWVLSMIGSILLIWGWQRFRVIAFPILFVFFALPLPQRFHIWLQGHLQSSTTIIASKTLSILGVNVDRQGFQLHLPSGDLEVVEACSGIRSVTALCAIAAFVAHIRGFGLVKGLLLLALSLPMIVIANVVRIVTTGILQEGFGRLAVTGIAHDALGILVILIGLALILLTASLLQSRSQPQTKTEAVSSVENSRENPRLVWLTSGLLSIGLVGSLGVYADARSHQNYEIESVAFHLLPKSILGFEGQDGEVPPEVLLQLAPDQVLYRRYRNPFGQEIDVWLLYWSSKSGMRGYHHPDVCWPNHGWTLKHKEMVSLPMESNEQVPITVRRFQRDHDEHVLCYWTQEGSRIWTEMDEQQLRSTDTLGLIRERLFVRRPFEQGRIAFLIGGDVSGRRNYATKSILALSQQISQDIYRRCPWADPTKHRIVLDTKGN